VEGSKISAGKDGIKKMKECSIADGEPRYTPQTEAVIVQIRERARNLFETRQMLCTEAVVVTINSSLDGGLTDVQAVAMAAPFCMGLGESGCMCGALSGAVMVTGLFLGKDQPYRNRRDLRESARQLHDAFKASNGATCCRVLSQKVKHDKKAHFQQCADLTAESAEMAARLILKKRPELIDRLNKEFIAKRESGTGSALLRLYHYWKAS
jgi:C_GCAxxG_C_C family probable redox protein